MHAGGAQHRASYLQARSSQQRNSVRRRRHCANPTNQGFRLGDGCRYKATWKMALHSATPPERGMTPTGASTPVRPRPNRIFIHSIAHFPASKIPASPERCLSPPTPQPLAVGATHHCRGSTPQATTFSTLGTAATTNRCRDQIRRDGLHPHLGTATLMDLTRTINHTWTPTSPRHHRRHLTRRWSGARYSPGPA